MIIASILNYNRPIQYVCDIVESLQKQTIKPDRILVFTNQKHTDLNENDFPSNIEFRGLNDINVASAKNDIIDNVREIDPNCKLFIIEDDVDILQNDALEKYVNTLDDLGLGILFSCYTNTSNYVLTIPSPRIKVLYDGLAKNTSSVITNRHEVGDFILIDLQKNKLKFNESLSYFEFSEYLFRCWKDKMIPALNQFFDIPDAWKYVRHRKNTASMRKYDELKIKSDKETMAKIIDNGWKIENDIKVVIDHIRSNIGV